MILFLVAFSIGLATCWFALRDSGSVCATSRLRSPTEPSRPPRKRSDHPSESRWRRS